MAPCAEAVPVFSSTAKRLVASTLTAARMVLRRLFTSIPSLRGEFGAQGWSRRRDRNGFRSPKAALPTRTLSASASRRNGVAATGGRGEQGHRARGDGERPWSASDPPGATVSTVAETPWWDTTASPRYAAASPEKCDLGMGALPAAQKVTPGGPRCKARRSRWRQTSGQLSVTEGLSPGPRLAEIAQCQNVVSRSFLLCATVTVLIASVGVDSGELHQDLVRAFTSDSQGGKFLGLGAVSWLFFRLCRAQRSDRCVPGSGRPCSGW